MDETIRYTLLQARDSADRMLTHELECFARGLGVHLGQIQGFDLLTQSLDPAAIARSDVFLLGGSGDYSVTGDSEWLLRALDGLRAVHASSKPTFASCWGFQAMARAMGGVVVHDRDRAELGSHRLFLTEAGARDPLFRPLREGFLAQMGHEDRVETLPANTTLLASSDLVAHQAYRFDDAPIYCTQFHPELRRGDLLVRFQNYPHYLEEVAGKPLEEFARTLEETPEAEQLLIQFRELLVEGG